MNKYANLAKSLGNRVAAARANLGITQQALNQKLNRKQTAGIEVFLSPEKARSILNFHISEIEAGKRLPPVHVLIGLSRTLGISIDELVFGEPWKALQVLTSLRCYTRPYDGPERDAFLDKIVRRLGAGVELDDEDELDDISDFEDSVAFRLKSVRESLGLSCAEVSRRLKNAGFSSYTSQVARAETPAGCDLVRLPTLRYLIGFAVSLDVSLDYLLLGEYTALHPLVSNYLTYIPFAQHRQAILEMAQFPG